MEKEISSGAMLGIVLIALAAIIGLGFGVFAIAKGTANEGVTNVQENLDAVGQSAYTDYDQKIVTGTQVNSCYQNFNGKNVAILIATQATKDKDIAGSDNYLAGSGVGAAYTDNGAATATLAQLPVVRAYKTEAMDDSAPYEMSQSKANGKAKDGAFINYNALLYGARCVTSSADNASGTASATQTYGKMYFDTNCFKTTSGYGTDSGKVVFNNVTANMNKSGMMEYVPSGARFQAYLIKDASGTIMGIAFEQIGTGR